MGQSVASQNKEAPEYQQHQSDAPKINSTSNRGYICVITLLKKLEPWKLRSHCIEEAQSETSIVEREE